MKKRQSIPFALLLAAFLLWLYFRPDTTLPQLPEHHPSYIAHQVDSTHYDQTGFLDRRIFADRATNYHSSDSTVFINPKVILYIKNEPGEKDTVWQLTANNGVLYKQEKLLLTDNVLVKNLSLDQQVQTMKSEEITIYLDTKEITSELLVTWLGPQMQQQGIGMWASLVTEELIVKDNIKAVYNNEN
ncbi:MAG: LPS export ABC transporter periplasmic protein LptC [Psychromonas sp.]|nr:LPS export ABC transporter periplasmic protein LptC [Psychromonas sp.]